MIWLICHLYHFCIQVNNIFSNLIIQKLIYLAFTADRSNVTDRNNNEGSELPEFTDVKIFIDSLLIGYQTNTTIKLELERKSMTCTPYRRDFIFGIIKSTSISIDFVCLLFLESGAAIVTTVLVFIDLIFLIP
jgi:hypothetical protein